ncbi:hypothetical protein D3C73_890970 [compost metagenome]
MPAFATTFLSNNCVFAAGIPEGAPSVKKNTPCVEHCLSFSFGKDSMGAMYLPFETVPATALLIPERSAW